MNTKITKKEFEMFRIRFGSELSKRGLSCTELIEDTEAKEYVSNFVTNNIISKENINRIQNITYKLANMQIVGYALSEEKSLVEFPIINKYIGRTLVGSYFFERFDNKINEVFIELKSQAIIIP